MVSSAPFDPDPACPLCSGAGFVRSLGDHVDQTSRCDCTNWSAYADLRRSKGLTMKQAIMEEDKNMSRRAPMTRSWWWYPYASFVDATSGGRVYQTHWMSKRGIPPVPVWTVEWFFNLKDPWDRKDRRSDQGGRDGDTIPF